MRFIRGIARTLAIWALLFADDIYRGFTGNVVTLLTLPMNVAIALPLMLAYTGHAVLDAMIASHVRQRGDAMPRWIRERIERLSDRGRA